MPKVLLIKTSSMGDLIHTMPAITDLAAARDDIELHWLVEEGFAAIPLWHPSVRKVHCCAIRRWRSSLLKRATRDEIRALKHSLQAEQYDLVIDAQGLLKSAWMARWLPSEKHGYDRNSIREPLASRVYDVQHAISRQQTAIDRNRQLLAAALGYALPAQRRFGLAVQRPADLAVAIDKPYVLLLHGTNWASKIWPLACWQELARRLSEAGLQVYLPWGSDEERARAGQIASHGAGQVLPRLSLTSLAFLLQHARLVVGSDTGLSHLAAALDTPTLGIYGSTDPALTGLVGSRVINLAATMDCAPCMKRECPKLSASEPQIPCYRTVDADRVWQALQAANWL